MRFALSVQEQPQLAQTQQITKKFVQHTSWIKRKKKALKLDKCFLRFWEPSYWVTFRTIYTSLKINLSKRSYTAVTNSSVVIMKISLGAKSSQPHKKSGIKDLTFMHPAAIMISIADRPHQTGAAARKRVCRGPMAAEPASITIK